MSSIERLKIQGIRSFGPDKNDEADIKFSSPLTLILGQNGCGKTTIIEALKYACCGELPAGTDGGSGFVHDPKLANLNEVKANIKLLCRDMRGNAKTVSRAVRVVQKFKKLEFKSIDATFTDGEKQETVSGKCADIDAMMCQALGTSQAVLINVIFCHQEDSLWPLEKGKKVKEKFDAIFGITEYNKCLDYFRAMSKELDTKKTILKKDVECSRKFWEDAREKRKKLDDLKGKASANRDTISQMTSQIEPIIAQIAEIVHKEDNFADHKAKIKIKIGERNTITKTINETKEEIREEFHGSKDALLNEMSTFEKRLKETKDKILDLNAQKKDLLTEEKRIQKEIEKKSMSMGTLQREQDQHKDRIDDRNSRLRNLGTELEVNVVSYSQLNDSSSEDVLREIENKVQNRISERKDLQDEQKRLQFQIQSKIDAAREKRATLTQDILTKEKTIESNRKEIAKVQAEIAEVDKSGHKLAALENNLKTVEKQLTEAIASLNVDECKAGIEKANDDIKKFEEKSVLLDKEIKQLQQISVEKANLNKLIERRQNLGKALNSLEEKHRGTLQHLFTSIPETGLRIKLEARIKELSNEISNHESEINKLERDLSRLMEQKRNLDEQIKQKKKKMSQDQEKIEDCCGEMDIHEYHKTIKKKLQDSTEVKGTVQATKFLFSKYLLKLQGEERVCPLCHREFTDLTDYEEILNDLKERIDESPDKLRTVDADIVKYAEAQDKAARLLQLGNDLKKMKEVELPKLKSDLDGIENKIKDVKSQIESRQNELVGPQADREMARSILTDVILMDQHKQEIQTLEREIKNLQDKLPTVASGRTLDQANEEQDKLKSDLTNLRKKLNIDQRSLSSYNDRVNNLQKQKTELTDQKLKIVGGAQKRESLTEKLEELNMAQVVLQKELEQARAQLRPIKEELNEMEKTLTQMRTQHELLLDEKRKAITDLEKRVDEIKKLQSIIADYAKRGGSRRLNDVKEELTQLKQQKENVERRKNTVDKELETHTNFQNTHELQKHNLDANLKLRNKKEELAVVEDAIKELEGHVKDLNYDQLRREKEKLEDKRRNLDNMMAKAKGMLQEVIANTKDLERELNQPLYKEAEDEYRKSEVKLAVTSKSVEDLKLYEKAMDWAMIHFHKERMKMINSIIRELWRLIYRGNDVDYIEIKTDEGTSTASGRRTYNYKVVQVKSGVEIDMPGRCSAGQKVLACLIIRMALAETFCKNCGILALDEPTTNLDRENVESLSDALASIVERRSYQRNFQLLVITHDEDFLRKLFRVDKVEHYLEVRRDDRGRSRVIQRQAFL